MIHIRHFHKEQGLCAQNTDVDKSKFRYKHMPVKAR